LLSERADASPLRGDTFDGSSWRGPVSLTIRW